MKGSSNATSRRKYDSAFKAEVLKMVESGRPVVEVAQALGVGENLIYRWRNKAKARAASDHNIPANQAGYAAVNTDVLTLQKRIQQLETERDILKKALAIFSRQM